MAFDGTRRCLHVCNCHLVVVLEGVLHHGEKSQRNFGSSKDKRSRSFLRLSEIISPQPWQFTEIPTIFPELCQSSFFICPSERVFLVFGNSFPIYVPAKDQTLTSFHSKAELQLLRVDEPATKLHRSKALVYPAAPAARMVDSKPREKSRLDAYERRTRRAPQAATPLHPSSAERRWFKETRTLPNPWADKNRAFLTSLSSLLHESLSPGRFCSFQWNLAHLLIMSLAG